MPLNNARIQELLGEHNLSQTQLASKIGITRGALSNALSGRRGIGRKILVGLLRAFPGETIETLTFSKRQVVV